MLLRFWLIAMLALPTWLGGGVWRAAGDGVGPCAIFDAGVGVVSAPQEEVDEDAGCGCVGGCGMASCGCGAESAPLPVESAPRAPASGGRDGGVPLFVDVKPVGLGLPAPRPVLRATLPGESGPRFSFARLQSFVCVWRS